jgi:copper oxidase (laccase) domain-containing protein
MTIDVLEENKDQLLKLGIPEENIKVFDNCTFCDASFNWPSYRKDGKIKRRIISYITWIK